MRPATAGCLFLLGGAVAMLAPVASRRLRILRSVFAVFAAAVGVGRLAEFALGADLGIDRILAPASALSSRAGHVSWPTAVCVVLLSLAVLTVEQASRRGVRPSQWLALSALAVLLVPIADYAADLDAAITGIAIHTILGLLLLSAGVLSARPDTGVMRLLTSPYSGATAARRGLPLVFFIPVLMGAVHWTGSKAGFLGMEEGFVFMTLGTIVLGTVALVWHAARLNRLEELSQQDRERAERGVAEHRSYARTLLEASLDPLVTISREGKITDANLAAEAVTGVPRERLVGSDFSDCFTDAEKARRGYRQVFEQGSVRDYPLAMRHVSGRVTDVLYNASVFRDPAGEVAGVFAAARDITERKRAEEELHRANRALRTIRLCHQAMVHSGDEAGMNSAICRVIVGEGGYRMAWVGYAEDDDNKTIRPVASAGHEEGYLSGLGITWADTERGRGPTGTAVRTGRPVLCGDFATDPGIGPWREAACRRGYASSLSLPLLSAGKAFGALSIYSAQANAFDAQEIKLLAALADDMAFGILSLRARSERETAEEQIRQLNETLEERVRQRTAEIAELNRKLDRQVLNLTTLNQELESFTYSVSHDLRAPLRHIAGFSQLLQEDCGDELSEEAAHYLSEIVDSTRRMGELVDDLLNLARVGRQDLTTQITGLRSLAEDVARTLARAHPERQMDWNIGDLPYVACDAGLMRQVFANLLGNAVKFTGPRARARIEVGAEERDGSVVVFVRDNGVGFSPKYAGKLFGVFQRLHRAEDFEGTGVGLATVQRIVQKHGGKVWAEGELDRGATFYFSLPRVESTSPAEEKPQEALHA